MDDRLVLPAIVDSMAQEDPDRIFVTEADTGRKSTRGEFRDQAVRWAGALRAAGVASGEPVALMLPTSTAALAAWVGVARLCAVEVPVNPQYRGEMLEYLINDAGARIMLVEQETFDQVVEVLPNCPTLEKLVVLGAESPTAINGVDVVSAEAFLDTAVSVDDLPYPKPHDIAAVVYTSGTTGPSKGVMMPWAQMRQTALWLAPSEQLGPDDVVYLPYPFYHVTIKCPVYMAALLGGRVVVRDKISVTSYWDDIRDNGATYTNLLGVMVNMLMQAPEAPEDSDNPLRLVGVVPRPPAMPEFERRFGVSAGTIFNMTETSVPLVDHTHSTKSLSSCGRPRPGCTVQLVDAFDRPVEQGEVGELIVRTDEPWTLNAGYWRKPEATAQAWRNGWFHTGDAFRQDENGDFFFVDRFKDSLRRRGENISSMEVEQLVLRNDQVMEAAVIGVASPLGEEDVKVFVVRKPGSSISGRELHTDLVNRMPKFMVPRYIEFIDELPKTPTYKIRKVDLRDRNDGTDLFDAEGAVNA